MRRKITLFFAVVLLAGCYSNPHTPTGHEGYVFESPRVWGKGGFLGVVNGPGNFGVSIWNNKNINIDVRPKTYTEVFKILANDQLNIAFRAHLIIRPKQGNVKSIVQDYSGLQWYKTIIREPYRTFVRDCVQPLNSMEVKSKRPEIAAEVKKALVEFLEYMPFIVIEIAIGNIDYPDVVTKAVENKLAMKQLLEEKETQELIAIKDAQIKIQEAKGIAAAQKIINKTLTSNYLQHEAIEAQKLMAGSPNTTVIYVPVGNMGVPLIKEIH